MGEILLNDDTGGFGRCFELAAEYVLTEPVGNYILVHGKATSKDDELIDHAWVETTNATVYDVAKGEAFIKERYMTYAVEEKRYTRKQTALLLHATGHYGPWTAEDEVLALEVAREWNAEKIEEIMSAILLVKVSREDIP